MVWLTSRMGPTFALPGFAISRGHERPPRISRYGLRPPLRKRAAWWPLERDVVVRAAARADRGALEVRGVGRDVGARLEGAVAATTARVVRARAQELHAVGDD